MCSKRNDEHDSLGLSLAPLPSHSCWSAQEVALSPLPLPFLLQMYKLKQEKDELVKDLGALQSEHGQIVGRLRSSSWAQEASSRLGCKADDFAKEISTVVTVSPEESVEERLLKQYGQIERQNGKTRAELERRSNAKIVL
jgi:hypothetical protein